MLRDRIIDELNRQIKEDADDITSYCTGNFDFPSGSQISLTVFADGTDPEVEIYSETGREHPNVEAFCLQNAITWDEVTDDWDDDPYDEWNTHGFASEADFWHWKLG